jgi:phosphoglycolate phosphatase
MQGARRNGLAADTRAGQGRVLLVSFDLDGTLVDSAPEIAEAVNRALAAHGIARLSDDAVRALIGDGLQALLTRLVEGLPSTRRPPVADLLRTAEAVFAEITGTRALPFPGCAQALDDLRTAGLNLACVSNKESTQARRLLAALGLEPRFDLIIGGDTLPVKKPHAEVLTHVARTLGVACDAAIHVGDSAIDVQAARNAGFAAWAVTHGYNGGRSVAEAGPDALFGSLPEVVRAVLG